MNDKLLEKLGELQDRLDELESASKILKKAEGQVSLSLNAARDVTEAAKDVTIKAKEMRKVTLALESMPAAIEAVRSALTIESTKIVTEISASTDNLRTLTREEARGIRESVDRNGRTLIEKQNELNGLIKSLSNEVAERFSEVEIATASLKKTSAITVILIGFLLVASGVSFALLLRPIFSN